jgi:hypothetical protein
MTSDDTTQILNGELLSSKDWDVWINFCGERISRKKEFSFYPVNSLPFKKRDIANRAISHLTVCENQSDIDVVVRGLNVLCCAQPFSFNKNKRAVKDILHWVNIGTEVGLPKVAVSSLYELLLYFDPNGKYHDVSAHF